MADDDNMDSQYTSPNDGRDWGYHCFNLVNILDTQAANKGISIDWQNDVWLTEMKMWARHDDRTDPDPDRKWRFENTVLDESAFGDYGFEQPETEITAHAFQVDGKVIHNVDAKVTKGDDHNIVLTYSATNTNACSFSIPLPMVVEPDALLGLSDGGLVARFRKLACTELIQQCGFAYVWDAADQQLLACANTKLVCLKQLACAEDKLLSI